MEKDNCLLCNHDAERGVFTDAPDQTKVAGGYKYKCPECGLFALDEYGHNWVELRATNEQKIKISKYVKDNPAEEGYFKVLKWKDIKSILRLPYTERDQS